MTNGQTADGHWWEIFLKFSHGGAPKKKKKGRFFLRKKKKGRLICARP
jgi:hypothetical protein